MRKLALHSFLLSYLNYRGFFIAQVLIRSGVTSGRSPLRRFAPRHKVQGRNGGESMATCLTSIKKKSQRKQNAKSIIILVCVMPKRARSCGGISATLR